MRNGWHVAPASAISPDAFASLEADAFGPMSWGSESIRAGLTAVATRAIIVQSADDGVAAGFAMWRAVGDEGEILTIGVAPSRRRNGAASAMLSAIIAEAREARLFALFLEVAKSNVAARGLYVARGFAPVGERRAYYRDGGDALVLRRTL